MKPRISPHNTMRDEINDWLKDMIESDADVLYYFVAKTMVCFIKYQLT